MNMFFKRCPIEITYYIMQYTYMPQNKILLNDIVNFTEKKQELYKIIIKLSLFIGFQSRILF